MTIEHADIVDNEIHEPKGMSTATEGQIYVADGLGSGAWSDVPTPYSDGASFGTLIFADGAGDSTFDDVVWKDMLGEIIPRQTGPSAPSFSTIRGAIDAYAFSASDETTCYFHIPHDYALGTDIYLHVHWTHNGTAISGNMVWAYSATYAKGHNQAIFPAEVTGNISYATTDIATTPQYIHRIDEVHLSAAIPGAAQLDSDDIEPDGIIIINIVANTIPTITGGSPNEPFLLYVDLHYQANKFGTKNKAPDFDLV